MFAFIQNENYERCETFKAENIQEICNYIINNYTKGNIDIYENDGEFVVSTAGPYLTEISILKDRMEYLKYLNPYQEKIEATLGEYG